MNRVEKSWQRDSLRFVSYFEKLPTSVVDHVIANEELLEATPDQRLKQFTDVNFVLKNAAFFATGRDSYSSSDARIRVQSPNAHRAFTIKYASGLQDEHGVMYGQLNVKGTGISRKTIDAKHFTSHPWGLFGERHAIQDMWVSNLFARHGGRTARGVAVVILNHEKLRSWYKNISHDAYDLNHELEKVESNGDNACLYVRTIGADRVGETDLARVNRYGSGLYGYNQVIERGFRTVQSEIDCKGIGEFMKKYGLPDHFVSQFSSIKDGAALEKLAMLIYFSAHMFQFNKAVLKHLSTVHVPNLVANIHTDNQDITGSWIDWENSLPESGQIMENLDIGVLHDLSGDMAAIKKGAEYGFKAGVRTSLEKCSDFHI